MRGGMNISIRQVEDLTVRAPERRCGRDRGDARSSAGGPGLLLLVPATGAQPLTLQERDFLLGKGLAMQKVPERLEVVGALPMTATGR